ncbi:hypothetical protein R7Q39_18975 [Vibrio sp. 947]|uniref:hypothetical protein n=1 Tax=unclassified Vibrio TaxID=2614977 RepID=UPI0029653571|nr:MULTISPECIES: hypothetical protein [unclassified Vibrio]MDW1583826.1 hypothetical protein [Vibrio sp. Vb2897]MDW1642097.1 hypothetical protein [Vibrio sp. Vb2896]MDW1927514.1 hypothetical protein [Vibrio sp. 947]
MFGLIRVVKGIAKLQGDESEDQMCAMAAGHSALRSNGWLATVFELDKEGKPSAIVSYWKVSDQSGKEKLPRGQKYAFIPKSVFEKLAS